MSEVRLKKYGLNLSGRPFGISTLKLILNEYQPPYELNFLDVISIGSSFADEVVAKLAKLNNGKIKVINFNPIIKKCLDDVSKDNQFEIIYE